MNKKDADSFHDFAAYIRKYDRDLAELAECGQVC